MKLLVEIPEEQYRTLNAQSQDDVVAVIDDALLIKAIKNGTPLPEHHGDLKDVDEIVKAIEDRVEFLRKNDAIFMRLHKDIDILGCIPKIRCEVPTIIPATKERSCKTCTHKNDDFDCHDFCVPYDFDHYKVKEGDGE